MDFFRNAICAIAETDGAAPFEDDLLREGVGLHF